MKKGIRILAAMATVALLGTATYKIADDFRIKDKIWLSQHVSVVSAAEKNLGYQVINNEKDVSYLNLDYQNTVTSKIEKMIKAKKYTLTEPLFIKNPYGTNNLSINAYFDTTEASYISYKIETEDFPDFEMTLYNGEKDNLAKKHAYQIIGFIPEKTNTLTLYQYDKDGKLLEQSKSTIYMPALESGIDTQINTTDGTSDYELVNGLYCMLGHDKAFQSNLYMYDNDGILRAEIPLSGYRTDRVLTIDNKMVISYDTDKIAMIDNMGKITKKYSFKGYELHHDFVYDEKNDKILMLVTKLNEPTVEDFVISLDMKTGKITELLDFRKIMPEAYENATKPEDSETLDWIHFNTIDIIDGKEILLSSRETSTIINVDNIYENPTLKYLISDKSIWEGTSYESYVYEKVGDFVAQAGQHTVTYVPDDSLPDGQYYLHMYNNNLAYWPTNTDFKWTEYPGTGSFNKGEKSMYYRYLVDENKKTFTLVKSFDVPYSSIVSSTQELGDNYVTSSGRSHHYGEYDKDGELIREFVYEAEKYTYRVFKYDFNNFWFVYDK